MGKKGKEPGLRWGGGACGLSAGGPMALTGAEAVGEVELEVSVTRGHVPKPRLVPSCPGTGAGVGFLPSLQDGCNSLTTK